MRNSDMPAMPCRATINRDTDEIQPYQFGNNDFVVLGLTKREEIASRTMAGILANAGAAMTFNNNANLLVDVAIEYTDILLKKLEENK